MAKPIQIADRELIIDPYLYGYWLGNGCATKPEITVCDADFAAVTDNIPYQYYNTIQQPGSIRVYYHELRKILVPTFRDKVILPEYLRASEQQRWAGPETPASCEFLDSEQELPQNLQPGVLQGAGLVVPRSQPACLPLSKIW